MQCPDSVYLYSSVGAGGLVLSNLVGPHVIISPQLVRIYGGQMKPLARVSLVRLIRSITPHCDLNGENLKVV
jgi:hypothetical protein